jgi:hypothetical protein
MSSPRKEGRFPPFLLPLTLTLAALAYRAPMLLSASGATNSDSAVVGLQALHFASLRDLGTTSFFLWGSHYQTAADSWVCAAVFTLFGASPRALMATSLALYVVLILFAYGTLSTPTLGIGRVRAALLVSLLVFAGAPVHGYALFPPRQVALTLAFGAIFAAERAELRGKNAELRLRPWLGALAGALGMLAVLADPYALLFVPALAVRALWYDRSTKLATFAGAALGAVPFAWLTTRAAASHGTFGFSPALLGHNLQLLAYPCLPWALSAVEFTPAHFLRWEPWVPRVLPALVAVGPAGAASLIILLGFSAAQPFLRRSKRGNPQPKRHTPLAVSAWVSILATLVAFAGSVMVMDLFSTRYLVALVLLVPFVLAPLAAYVPARSLALFLVAPLAAGVLSGIAGYGPFVREVDDGAREAALVHFLDAQQVSEAVADYWVSYRVTFLTGERLVVVPLNPAEDRWPPYRQQVEHAPRVAYLWDPQRSRETLAEVEAKVRATGVPFERSDVAGYQVLITSGNGATALVQP